MADIKTREITKGTIKTLNRAASSMYHLKEDTIRSKSAEIGSRYDNESAGSYVNDTVEHYAGSAAAFTARESVELILKSREHSGSIRQGNSDQIQRAFMENGMKTMLERRERSKAVNRNVTGAAIDSPRIAGNEIALSGKNGANPVNNINVLGRTSGRRRKYSAGEELIRQRKKEYAIKRIRQRNSGNRIVRRLSAAGNRQSAGKAADRMRRILRDLAESTKALLTAVTSGSAAAILIIVIMIICGGMFAMLGDEDGNDFAFDFYGIGYGDAAIVKVAQAELGNVGGDKFWKWYGFKNHVDWCAIFVSWCGNQCGYIKEGIIPRFAVVGDGARWFKNKNQWASRGYEPKGGDIIFFDYERDGLLDHVGIVESCDGKTVTTIEGNSGNVCRRQTYKVGSKQIAGYGVPMYGMLVDPGDFTGMQANMVAWAKKIAADDSYGYKTWSSSNANSHKCPLCHPGSGKGWNCIGFAFAAWHHGGGLKSKCNCSVVDNGTWERILNAKSDAQAIRIATDRIGVPVIVIRNNGNTIPQSKIRAGDICGCFNGNTCYHITFSIGNGEIIHSTHARNKANEIAKRKAIPCTVVIRYAGIK